MGEKTRNKALICVFGGVFWGCKPLKEQKSYSYLHFESFSPIMLQYVCRIFANINVVTILHLNLIHIINQFYEFSAKT